MLARCHSQSLCRRRRRCHDSTISIPIACVCTTNAAAAYKQSHGINFRVCIRSAAIGDGDGAATAFVARDEIGTQKNEKRMAAPHRTPNGKRTNKKNNKKKTYPQNAGDKNYKNQ